MKPFWQSKTVLVSVLNLILVYAGAGSWVAQNPDDYMALVSALVVVLRIISKDKVMLA